MNLALNILDDYKQTITYFDLPIKNDDDKLKYHDSHYIDKCISLFHFNDYNESSFWFDKTINVLDN